MTTRQDTGLQRFARQPEPGSAPRGVPGGRPPEQAPRGAPGPPGTASERCELCATPVPGEHGHIADLESSSLLCACRACYLLFTQAAAGKGRYRSVPDRYLCDPSRVMSPADLDELQVPVGLAFFLRSSRAGSAVTGFYPSPAGATECQLDLGVWQQLSARFPLLAAPADDVEAALVSRTDGGAEYYLVPVDACYELAGRMRQTWRGFDGGREAQTAIADFRARLRQRARPCQLPEPHA